MSRKLRNWSYRDVINFLKEHEFAYGGPLKGSHQAWIKCADNGEIIRRVEVSVPRDSYKPKTMKAMIRQSGIGGEEWFKWGNS